MSYVVLLYSRVVSFGSRFSCLLLFSFWIEILGGGFSLGSLVMVMEDPEAPHHMLLLRNFMSQGLVQKQPLLYASASRDPKSFLGTLPSLVSPKGDKSSDLGQVLFFNLCSLHFVICIITFFVVIWFIYCTYNYRKRI